MEIEPAQNQETLSTVGPKIARPLAKNLRFLVAYENATVRRSVCSILKEMGFSHIEERREHEDFHRTLRVERIQCLICGPEALRKNCREFLRSVDPRDTLPPLLVIGLVSAENKEKIAGISPAVVADYIVFPCSSRRCEKQIRALLEERFPAVERPPLNIPRC